MGTYDQDKREKMSIFGFFVVEIYNVTKQSLEYEDNSNEFFCHFSEDIIENDMNSRPTRPPSWRTGKIKSPVYVRKLLTAHLFQKVNKQRLNNVR